MLLRFDFNFRTYRNQLPYFLNLLVRHGYASVCPVEFAVKGTQLGKCGCESVDHDVSAGWAAGLLSATDVFAVRIRDVESDVVVACFVATIDYVTSFRCSVVPFARFCA